MTTFLAFTTIGLVAGCIYALTATGHVRVDTPATGYRCDGKYFVVK